VEARVRCLESKKALPPITLCRRGEVRSLHNDFPNTDAKHRLSHSWIHAKTQKILFPLLQPFDLCSGNGAVVAMLCNGGVTFSQADRLVGCLPASDCHR